MATWDPAVEEARPVDYSLVRNGFVTMFWRNALLAETVAWLRSREYHVVDLDAAGWTSTADMYAAVAEALDFPDYFGKNLDALNDCIGDVASGDYGWQADAAAGLVVVLRGFDAFTALDRRTAQVMLDIFADHARQAILIGHRLFCLVQSTDPQLAFEPVGTTPVTWNDAEWLDAKRGLGADSDSMSLPDA